MKAIKYFLTALFELFKGNLDHELKPSRFSLKEFWEMNREIYENDFAQMAKHVFEGFRDGTLRFERGKIRVRHTIRDEIATTILAVLIALVIAAPQLLVIFGPTLAEKVVEGYRAMKLKWRRRDLMRQARELDIPLDNLPEFIGQKVDSPENADRVQGALDDYMTGEIDAAGVSREMESLAALRKIA